MVARIKLKGIDDLTCCEKESNFEDLTILNATLNLTLLTP
jgi:hypothetical protein